MAVTLEVTNEEITAYLSGEIDHHSAVELRRRIDEAVLAGTPEWLILDFSGVTFMDSSGIGLIMGRWRLMQEQGGRLTVRGVPKTLRKVMRPPTRDLPARRCRDFWPPSTPRWRSWRTSKRRCRRR